VDKQKIGKLLHVVMLARWQEAALKKKYSMKTEECNELHGELLDARQLLENKERDHHASEIEVRAGKQLNLRLQKEL